MSPYARISLCATMTALGLAVTWLVVRLFVITESFGIRLTEEVIIAFVGGLIVGGMAANGYETWLNLRDQSDELARLCASWGFTFSKPSDKADLGRLADSPLLQRYIKVITRMSGTTSGHPVDVLDVSRWVQRQSDGTGSNDQFEWRHTIVLFPAMTDLPTFGLFPLTFADRYLNSATGAKGVTFEHARGALNEGIGAEFQRQYFVWPGDRSFFSSPLAPPSDNVQDLGTVFSAKLITYLAEHPGWCVEVMAGQVAIWREDRIVPPAARASLLAGAARLYHLLVTKPAVTQAAAHVKPEVPRDYQRFSSNLFRLFIGVGVGIWAGFAVGVAILIFLLEPWMPKGNWQPFVFFPGLLGCMIFGAYLGYRVARQFTT